MIAGILRFLNYGGGGGGGQIDWLEGVQYAITVPGPHRCQCIKFKQSVLW